MLDINRLTLVDGAHALGPLDDAVVVYRSGDMKLLLNTTADHWCAPVFTATRAATVTRPLRAA